MNFYTSSILDAIDQALMLASFLRIDFLDRFTGSKFIRDIPTHCLEQWYFGGSKKIRISSKFGHR